MRDRIVCMIGEGAWGTAVSTLLAHNGYTVKLWCHDHDVAKKIQETRYNERYLPGIKLDEKIQPVTDFAQAFQNVQWIFEAIPVQYVREVLQKAKPHIDLQQTWIVLSKGIEKDTLLLPTQIIADVFGPKVKTAVFVGPSFAQEVATKQITAVTLAAPDCTPGYSLQKLLANNYFRPFISTDMIGAQVGAALKNVITLGIGMLDGAGYSDNTKAFLLTRGLQEMVELSIAMGGKKETVYGLSGVGDLVLTSMGKLSKNLQVGKRLGSGQSLDDILQKTGYIPEGINTVQSAHKLMQKYNVQLPICRGIYDVIFTQKTIQDFLQELMAQPVQWECQ